MKSKKYLILLSTFLALQTTSHVSFAGPNSVCTRSTPAINQAGTAYGVPGDSHTFNFTFKNNDSRDCLPANFTIGDQASQGWFPGWTHSFSTTSMTVAPGSTGSFTETLTSPTTITQSINVGFTNMVTNTSSNQSAYGGGTFFIQVGANSPTNSKGKRNQ